MSRIWVKCFLVLLLAVDGDVRAQEPVAEAKIYLQSSRLAGFKYYEGRRVWPQLRVGDPLTLVREADNSYDSNAIGITWQGHKLGHVPRTENAALARFMDHGQQLEARIHALVKEKRRGRWIEFEVYLDH